MRKNGLVIGRCPKTDHEDVRRLRDGRTDGKIGHVMNRELKAVGWAGPKKYWRLFLWATKAISTNALTDLLLRASLLVFHLAKLTCKHPF